MQLARPDYSDNTAEERGRVPAHQHSGDWRCDKAEQQRGIHDQHKYPDRRILALEDGNIVFSVENMVRDDEDEHPDTDIFVQLLLCDLHRHEQQQSRCHQDVDRTHYYLLRFHASPPLCFIRYPLLTIEPALKLCIGDSGIKAVAAFPIT